LKGNENTYSFRLANILLAIGAHIDSALKEIAKYSDFPAKYPEMIKPKRKDGKPRYPTIRDYYPISDEYKFPEQIAVFKCLPNRENIRPFETYKKSGKGTLPYWWKAYNKVKHNFNEKFKEAKLKTVRDALAAAFLLNVIFEPATNRLFKYGIVKLKFQTDSFEKIPNFVRGKSRKPEYRPFDGCINTYLIETSLFIYEYEEWNESE
jgi:hypothetical protein